MLLNRLQRLLGNDQSTRDWLLRHGLYWSIFVVTAAVVCMYWWPSFLAALTGTLLHTWLLYIPTTYVLLYGVLPSLMDGRYDRFALRLLLWVLATFALRYALTQGLSVAMTSSVVAGSPLRSLFDGSFLVTNSFVIVAASLKLLRQGYRQEQVRQQLMQETLTVELQILKAQVHPHFLFNTLNNIYSLTLRGSDQAGRTVQQLMGLLGYMFREGDTPWVSVGQEWQLLRNYVDLEQVRYGNRLTVSMERDGLTDNGLMAPLLLLPFVENAFKHGASEQTTHASIAIAMRVTGDTLTFTIRNSWPPARAGDERRPGGLGLQNVQKRLQLLYPARHTLTIQSEAGQYAVTLTLPILTSPDRTRSGLTQPTSQEPLPVALRPH